MRRNKKKIRERDQLDVPISPFCLCASLGDCIFSANDTLPWSWKSFSYEERRLVSGERVFVVLVVVIPYYLRSFVTRNILIGGVETTCRVYSNIHPI